MEKIQDKRFLYVATDDINMRDIPEALHMLGYPVYELDREITSQGFQEEECLWLLEILRGIEVNHVVTYDFIETVAEACHEAKKNYIAWVYDSPQKELYTKYAFYETNFIFVFDERQWLRLREAGISNVYHLPLAASAEKVQAVLDKNPRSYTEEVSFVGQLYSTETFDQIVESAPENALLLFRQEMESFLLQWPDRKDDKRKYFHGTMPSAMVEHLGNYENHRVNQFYPYMGEDLYYEAAVMARMLANAERTEILNCLSKKHQVSLFTFDTNARGLSDKVEMKPGVGFDKEVYAIYQNSKINLNISLHCIETGIPQRVFDVLAAGGFLLTNYQEELERYFTPGKDLVVFHNQEELNELVEYYLAHDVEREEIAKNGQRTVWEKHNYIMRMKQVMTILDSHEKEKNCPVIVLTTPKDFERVYPAYEMMIRNLEPRKVFFLGSRKVLELIEGSPLKGRVGFVDEESLIPFDTVNETMKKALDVDYVSRGITGWYYQQFLKMAYAYQCSESYYMSWDGDTVPCAPFSMFAADGETPYFDIKTEYFEDYFITMGKLIPGLHKVIQGSFVSEHMLFDKEIMKELIETIEENDSLPGEHFYEKIIWSIPKEKLTKNSFSEFETYGTYVAIKHTNKYRIRRWYSFRYGGLFLHPETMTQEDYLWLSRDFHAVSYEKEQSIRWDHENLFQNKEYQRKLTARQMLEAAQQAFDGGMIEEW